MNLGGIGGGGRDGSDLRELRVLVVEDETLIALDLEAVLVGFGCEVLSVAPSTARALAALRAERPDVALLDLDLADGWATPVAEALVVAGVPFAVVTGHGRDLVQEPVLRAAPYLAKPYGRVALRKVLRRLSAECREPPSDTHLRDAGVPPAEQLQPRREPGGPAPGQ